jgi:hypothetical protein
MTAVGALNGFQTLLCERDVRVQKLDVIVRGPRRGLCWRLEIEVGEGKSEQLGDRHSFPAEDVLHPSAEACQGRTNVRREAVESLDESRPQCEFAATKEYLRVRSQRVSATSTTLRRSAGSRQRLQRSSRQFWRELAADCAWQTCQPN